MLVEWGEIEHVRTRLLTMPISNYTTKIHPDTTIGEISRMLSRFGAQRIITDYRNGEVVSLQFMLVVKEQMIFFQLPANSEGVLKTLIRDKAPHQYRNTDQARRVAWRIIRDWVESQIAIVDAGQAQMAEVFLPYAVTKDGKTLFQQIESNNIKLLAS